MLVSPRLVLPILLAALAPAAVAAAPTLRPLAAPAAAKLLDGELRCAFADRAGRLLLIAAADVDRTHRATAAARVAARLIRLTSVAPGGFDALVRGGRFRGAGLMATVARGAPIATGGEGTRHAATLRIARGGAMRLYRGVWSCGP